jgi:hypothetical protein
MTPIPVDISKLGPFGREWVEKEMPFDPIYNSLESLRDHERRAGGQVQAIEHIPDHMFPNAARRFGLIPWHPKTNEDYALLRATKGQAQCKHEHDHDHDHEHDHGHGHDHNHDPQPGHIAARGFLLRCTGHLRADHTCCGCEDHGLVLEMDVDDQSGYSVKASSDGQTTVTPKVKQIKKQLAEAKRNVTKQKTRLALKEAAVVALEKELAEAEERAGSM